MTGATSVVTRYLVRTAVLAGATAAVSGCASGRSAAQESVVFTSSAKTTCSMASREFARLPKLDTSRPTADHVRRGREILAAARRARVQLGTISAPTELAPDFVAALAAMDALHSAAEGDLAAASEGDPYTSIDAIHSDDEARRAALIESLMALDLPECEAIGAPVVAPWLDRPVVTSGNTVSFIDNVKRATAALGTYGAAVNRAGGPAGLAVAVPVLRASTATFGERIDAIRGDALDDPTLDGQRSRIVSAGLPLAKIMRDVANAAQAGDQPRLAKAAQHFETGASYFAQVTSPEWGP